ncbi:hypothetical protein K4039_24290 [Lyngbya sp. CCAP 1446/10]|uniref:hypothetical protein n=1 Tax=Lyngbya sp. CCAP 1446/10 TaxID=439293 RepID=UPI0022383231|nr:hypothetical protein [Lyngbya sp. CCAP 1446/10]MCW6053107.1 hypothetical protein [Lyngbya sp. CCAP 1446/10]
MKSLKKPVSIRYIGFLVSTALCLVSGQVKASEPIFPKSHAFTEATQELAQATGRSQTIALSGNNLTPAAVVIVAKNGAKVSISDAALSRVKAAHELLLLAAKNGQKK